MAKVITPAQVHPIVPLEPTLVGGIRAHVEAQVPLPHHRRLIPGSEQLFRQEGILEGHAARLGRSYHRILHADPVVIAACHELTASRRALLRRVEGHQLDALRSQPVDVGCMEGVVVEADILPAHVIQYYHEYVRLMLLRGGSSSRRCSRYRGSRVGRRQASPLWWPACQERGYAEHLEESHFGGSMEKCSSYDLIFLVYVLSLPVTRERASNSSWLPRKKGIQ